MSIIVDTSVWSLAFRRNQPTNDLSVDIFRVVRQEILSGIKYLEQYEKLKNELRAFPDLILEIEDYEVAASYFNICRQKGVQGSNTDFLLCAVASRRSYEILTTDNDFNYYSQHIPIKLMAQ